MLLALIASVHLSPEELHPNGEQGQPLHLMHVLVRLFRLDNRAMACLRRLCLRAGEIKLEFGEGGTGLVLLYTGEKTLSPRRPKQPDIKVRFESCGGF